MLKLEATQMPSTGEGMNKLILPLFNGLLLSKKKEQATHVQQHGQISEVLS